MPVHLIFLFIFQGGLAFAFSYFITSILLGGAQGEAHQRMLKGIGKIRLIFLGTTLILPAALFAAYFNSLPEGESYVMALWPAMWMLVILLAVITALTIAIHKKR